MANIRFPNGFTLTDKPDVRGFWRLRGPGVDRRFRSYAEAETEAWQLSLEAHQAASPKDEPNKEDIPTIADLGEMYLEGVGRRRQLAMNTRRSVTSNLRRHIIPVVGDVPCTSWTRAHTQSVMDKCEAAGLAPATIGRVVGDMSTFAALGVELGFKVGEPCKGLQPVRQSALSKGSLPSPTDVERVAEAMAEATGDDYRHTQVMFLAYTGLRVAEMLALRPSDVSSGVVSVVRQRDGRGFMEPKFGKQRETIYPAWLDGPLARLTEDADPNGPLFPAKSKRWDTYQRWRETCWNPAADKADWPKDDSGRRVWTTHTLRHYFGVWALSPQGLGLDIADVAMFMGHSSTETTHRLYVQTRPDRFGRAREASLTAGR